MDSTRIFPEVTGTGRVGTGEVGVTSENAVVK